MIPTRRLGLALLLLGGGASGAPTDDVATVLIGGCLQLHGDACAPGPDRTLTVVVAGRAPTTRIAFDGQASEPGVATRDPARSRHVVVVPDAARRMTVTTNAAEPFRVALVAIRRPDVVAESSARLRAGDAAGAATALADAPDDDPAVLSQRARVAFSGDDLDAAADWFSRAIAAHRTAGRDYEALQDATALAFIQTHRFRRFDEARALLDRFRPASWHGESQYFVAYFRGLVAFNAGDARTALRELDRAVAIASAMGWPRRVLHTELLLAAQFQQIGRHDEARTLLEAWRDRVPDDAAPCERATFLTNLGWTGLLELESGRGAVPATMAGDLAAAMALYDEHCGLADRVNGRVNLALAAFHAGDLERADAQLAEAKNLTDEPDLGASLWMHDLSGRIALARGDADAALARFARLESLAGATLSPSGRWRAAVGLAAAHAAAGDANAALDAFARADAILDNDVFRVPVDAGRESLLSARDWATRRHVALALDTHRVGDAYAISRAARTRVLRGLSPAERASDLDAARRTRLDAVLSEYQRIRDRMYDDNRLRWSLATDQLADLKRRNDSRARELRRLVDEAVSILGVARVAQRRSEPDAGTLVVAVQQLVNDWAVFVVSTDGIDVRRADCPPVSSPVAVARCAVEAVADGLTPVRRLRLQLPGDLAGVDFHALEAGNALLGERFTIVYDVDLGPLESPAGGAAIIVADPRGDLAAARDEALTVRRHLASTTRYTPRLLGPSEARGDTLATALPGSALLHYAGHARFGGRRGWDSVLTLADDTEFGIADVLALHAAPGLVVLSGCETSRSDDAGPAQSLGLAQAFLVAGTAEVVAANRPVRDDEARVLVDGFYRRFIEHGDAAEALREAQNALRRSQPGADWAAFRILSR